MGVKTTPKIVTACTPRSYEFWKLSQLFPVVPNRSESFRIVPNCSQSFRIVPFRSVSFRFVPQRGPRRVLAESSQSPTDYGLRTTDRNGSPIERINLSRYRSRYKNAKNRVTPVTGQSDHAQSGAGYQFGSLAPAWSNAHVTGDAHQSQSTEPLASVSSTSR